ncbi:MAG: ATP-binding protein [Methanothrix sp.]|uniref:ATP-binding protein n=1 Tax=Methanothrix sp. TaxID=90426 RepID=UPI003BB66127
MVILIIVGVSNTVNLKLEEVFKISGIPSYTFVEPVEYNKIKVSLRTPGRGMIVEGPSGIGKTCAIMNALNQLGISSDAKKLSARKKHDVEKIREILNGGSKGVIIIDDFHKLPNDIKSEVADYLKTLADEESQDIKIIIIGINRAGDSLIRFARDLVNRIDIIRFETNPFDKIIELITKGEKALNIEIESKDKLAAESYGSFYLAQLLSREVCMKDGVLEKCTVPKKINISSDVVKQSVYDNLSLSFSEIVEAFVAGPKFKSEGRAPYLHILKWLGESESWSISLREEIRKHPEARESVGQVIGKGYMKKFMNSHLRFDGSSLF